MEAGHDPCFLKITLCLWTMRGNDTFKGNHVLADRQDFAKYMCNIKDVAPYSKAVQKIFSTSEFFFWEFKTILDPHWDWVILPKLLLCRINLVHVPEEPVMSDVCMNMAYNQVCDSVWGTELQLFMSMTSLSISLFYCVFANASLSHLANSVSIIKYTLLQWLMYSSLASRWMPWIHGYRISLPCFIWLGDCLIIYTKWKL